VVRGAAGGGVASGEPGRHDAGDELRVPEH
jgi:hypothetical protein